MNLLRQSTMKDPRKAALLAARRVMNWDDSHDEAVFRAGFLAGIQWLKEQSEVSYTEVKPNKDEKE